MCNPPGITQLETSLAISSPYYFGCGIAAEFPRHLLQHNFDHCYLVSSRKLMQLFGNEILEYVQRAGIRCATVLAEDTEQYKTWDTLKALCEELIVRGASKDSILLALGGGMVGNVAGLAAALTFRGIRFVHIPTTLTAQTDRTLSNKQAINGSRGKNQFGVYHAPIFVWADAQYPRDEPIRQQQSGIVEGIKNVLISQDSTAAADHMLDLWKDRARWPDLVMELIQSKLRIIRKDPGEKHYAMILEYGHTFGHAIEWLSRGKLLHGEAISVGMCLAAELSHSLGYMSESLLREHYRLLGERLGTPTKLPEWLEPQDVFDAMRTDNKRTGKGVRFLLLRGCGQFLNEDSDYMTAVDPERVLDCLRRYL
jgi:3-dehydroquinate synthase